MLHIISKCRAGISLILMLTLQACTGPVGDHAALEPEADADGGIAEGTEIGSVSQAALLAQVVGRPGDINRGLRWCSQYEWITGVSVALAKDAKGHPYGIKQLNVTCAWRNGTTGTRSFDTGTLTSTVNYRSTAKPGFRLVGFGVLAGDWIDGIAPIYESFTAEQFQTSPFTGNVGGGTYRTYKCPKGWTVRGMVWTHDSHVQGVIKSMQLYCSP